MCVSVCVCACNSWIRPCFQRMFRLSSSNFGSVLSNELPTGAHCNSCHRPQRRKPSQALISFTPQFGGPQPLKVENSNTTGGGAKDNCQRRVERARVEQVAEVPISNERVPAMSCISSAHLTHLSRTGATAAVRCCDSSSSDPRCVTLSCTLHWFQPSFLSCTHGPATPG